MGELAGLEWTNIDFNQGVINVVQSQKFNERSKSYYISGTKNGKNRTIPITDDLQNVFDRIKSVQSKYGKTGEFVFSTETGAANKRQISDYMYNKKIQYGISQPVSIHAERRTLNSTMEAEGIPAAVRSAILSHSERVNVHNYTYDATDIEYKREVLARAGKQCYSMG